LELSNLFKVNLLSTHKTLLRLCRKIAHSTLQRHSSLVGNVEKVFEPGVNINQQSLKLQFILNFEQCCVKAIRRDATIEVGVEVNDVVQRQKAALP
jgi:hypothetical protein